MFALALALLLGCNDPSADASITVDVPGSPFQALPSADGCRVFVSFTRGTGTTQTGVALYEREGGKLILDRVIPVEGGPTGMALTHDGKMLIVASGDRVAFIDTNRMAVLGYQVDSAAKGRVYANVTADDKLAIIADENSRTVSIIDLPKAIRNGFAASSTIGKIPTGTLPIALPLSSDGKYLYISSQWAPTEYKWPVECKREGGNTTNDTTSINSQGAIHIVDMARAAVDPANSIVGNVPAGCSAVRLVFSPDEKRAYVTARNSNALLAFDATKLRTDPSHALIGRVPVGTAPVGVAVVHGGRTVIVTNSNRFAGTADDRQTLTVIDASKVDQGAGAIIGSIQAGAFPREMRVTSDGRTLILTNFGSRTVQMIDLARIPGAR
jgi:DNA-binding beta-propeller fold protein YncE